MTQPRPRADATEAFFGMHRSEVLTKYSRYLIGTIAGDKPQIVLPTNGTLSPVPYAEPTWLSEGFKSPYYRDSHRSLQKAMREFVDAEVREDAQMHEKDGKRPTVELVQKMGSPEMNLNAMVRPLSPAGASSRRGRADSPSHTLQRLGPSKLLHGKKLFGGVKPEEFDYFHEMIISQELIRAGARGASLFFSRRSPSSSSVREADGLLFGDRRLRRRPPGRHVHRPPARHELWLGRAQAEGHPRGPRRQEVHLARHHRGVRGFGRRRPAHDGQEDARRQALHRQRHQEVDHEVRPYFSLFYRACSFSS